MAESEIQRGDAVTSTERILGKWADRAFLTLWCYPAVYRDQDGGKEVCDLLVVFEDHIIIFSDKDVAYPDTGSADVDWRRWYKRAIQKSADQIFGAERWIREHPDRLFTDPFCKRPFPIPLPPLEHARFHRIVVAHDTTGRRRELIGGTGSLVIRPDILGDDHLLSREKGGIPFAIGQVAPQRGYVHVLDDSSLGLVLGNLDTITDFVAYLTKKERLIESGRLAFAYGEEDLLAYYLKYVDDNDEHYFKCPEDGSKVLLEEGQYRNLISRPEFVSKFLADRVSYTWDAIIEEFVKNIREGTVYSATDHALATYEEGLRLLAREPRIHRRMYAQGILEKLTETGKDRVGFRVFEPPTPDQLTYVLVCLPFSDEDDPVDYRERRRALLSGYCYIVMANRPQTPYVVGIATESGVGVKYRSHDLIVIDRGRWTEEDEKHARQLQEETGYHTDLRRTEYSEDEYPVERYFGASRKVGRNEPCPCGSGKKHKKCCWSG